MGKGPRELQIIEEVIPGILTGMNRDKFVDHTKEFVIKTLERDGSFTPTVWFMTGNNVRMYTLLDMPQEEDGKEHLSQYLHNKSDELKADASIFATEGWSAVLEKGQDPATAPKPSKTPNRKEVLLISVESKSDINTYCYLQNRDKKGMPHVKLELKTENSKAELPEEAGRFVNFIH